MAISSFCPICGHNMTGVKNCPNCAKTGGVDRREPSLQDLCADISKILGHGTGLTEKAPTDLLSAAKWFLKILEKPGKYEGLMVSKYDGDRSVYVWPYATRCIDCARKFANMTIEEQNTIIDGRRKGITWRGENTEMYIMIVAEAEKYRRTGKDLYISEVKRKSAGLLEKMKPGG